MARYTLSQRADQDVAEIYYYSFTEFGEMQADAYLFGMEEQLVHLADNPNIGVAVPYIREHYYRYIYASHVIYYRKMSHGIEIIRILHSAMKAQKHLLRD